MAFFGISLSSAPNSTSVGMRSRRPQQLPRMIVINSGGMSCRYSADAARGRGGLAQHGEVRGDIFVEG
jgi:hypothetical protein